MKNWSTTTLAFNGFSPHREQGLNFYAKELTTYEIEVMQDHFILHEMAK